MQQKVEREVMCLQVKEYKRLSAAQQMQGRSIKQILPQSPWKEQAPPRP